MTAVSKTWTTTSDFDSGTYVAANGAGNQVQDANPSNSATFPFVVACMGVGLSGGTIAVVAAADTTINGSVISKGTIIGQYRTAPSVGSTGPSRTGFDAAHGIIWVANQSQSSSPGSVCGIGLILGGERQLLDGTPSAGGEYIAATPSNPIVYCSGVDRDGDGRYRTSSGLGDVLDWTDAGPDQDFPAGPDGIVRHATDEAVRFFARTSMGAARTVLVSSNGNVWFTGYDFTATNNHPWDLVSWTDGSILLTQHPQDPTLVGVEAGGFASVITANGTIWSIDQTKGYVLKVSESNWAAAQYKPVPGTFGAFPYGIALNPNATPYEVWLFGLSQSCAVVDGTWTGGTPLAAVQLGTLTTHFGLARTAACTSDGHCWVACESGNYILRLRRSGSSILLVKEISVSPSGSTPVGVAVDANGYVWFAGSNSDTLHRIDPSASLGTIDTTVSLETASSPSNHSLFCGSVPLSTSYPSGSWDAIYDAGRATTWNTIDWNQTCSAAGQSVLVRWRSSSTLGGLASAGWNVAGSNATSGHFTMPMFSTVARYVEVQVGLQRNPTDSSSPLLLDLTISGTSGGVVHPAGPHSPAEPQPLTSPLGSPDGYAHLAGPEQAGAWSPGAKEAQVAW